MRVMPLIAVGLVVGIGTGWWLFGQRGAAVDIAPVDPASVIAVPGGTVSLMRKGGVSWPERRSAVSRDTRSTPGGVMM